MSKFFYLNTLRWSIRLPIKGALFGLTVLVVCFPYPRLLLRHIQHWSDPSVLVDPTDPALQPLIEELRLKITDELTPKQVLATVQEYVRGRIEYDWDWNTWGMADYLPTVGEAIALGREDCDGQAVVAASLLSHLGYDAELVTDFAHVWVKTEVGETMGPGKHKAIIASKKGLQVTFQAIGEVPRALGLGIAVFPFTRELVIVFVMWLLLLRRHGGASCYVTTLLLFVVGLYVLREGGKVYLKPEVWKQFSGVLLMSGGLACCFVWAGRNARRAGNEMSEIAGPSAGPSCKDLSKADVEG